MPTSPCQFLVIPFHAVCIAVDLVNKGTLETVQKIAGANFQSAFHYFTLTYKCA